MAEVDNGARLGPGSTATAFEYGDNIKYKVTIIFPEVPPAEKFNLNLEIFTLQKDEGIFETLTYKKYYL